MKIFKLIDIAVQTVLILISFLIVIPRFTFFLNDHAALLCYFVVGGVQLVSVLIHFFTNSFYKSTLRKLYFIFLLLIIILLLVAIVANVVFAYEEILALFLEVLLLFSPVMALFYLTICTIEYRKQFVLK